MASENFNQFGPTFQSKIISSLLSDNKFIQTISDILEPAYFDSDANKWLTREISKYFMEFRKAPTLEVLKIKITQMDDEILKVSVVENLKEAWRNIESTDLEFVKQETLGFCKNQVLKGAIVEAVDLLEQKKYDEIKNITQKKKRKQLRESGLWNTITEIEQFFKQKLVKDIVEKNKWK